MTRVSDLASQALAMSNLRQTQSRIDATSVQVSTGRVSETYSGIARDTARVVSLQSDQTRTQQYISSNGVLGSRLERMEANVASIIDVGTSFRTQLIAALNATSATASDVSGSAASALDSVAALLNEKLDGKALFAGNRTDQAPVDLGALPADGVFAADASTYYYQGDDAVQQATIADGQTLAYGVKADAQPFSDLIQAMQIAKTADTSTDAGRAQLQTALDLANKALDALPNVRSAIGSAQATLETATSRHEGFVLYATQAIGDVENVDAAQALTQLGIDQTVLQASYSAIAKLSQLSIIDYLR